MKLQHWAIIFIIIILPFSVITRNIITRKLAVLKDETRYNNIVDNATYDAVSQILEISELSEYGKKVPLTKSVCDAAIDRFFMTLAVNFNLPYISSRENPGMNSARSYFAQYIPAIVIVGYDGLYVYSYEDSGLDAGYEFVLKPKIPYAETIQLDAGEEVTINYTLDNYVSLYFNDSIKFLDGQKSIDDYSSDSIDFYPLEDKFGQKGGTHIISGYVGRNLDINADGVDDLKNIQVQHYLVENDPNSGVISYTYKPYTKVDKNNNIEQYTTDDDPYSVSTYSSPDWRANYLMDSLPSIQGDNLSYYLSLLARTNATGRFGDLHNKLKKLNFIIYNNDDGLFNKSEGSYKDYVYTRDTGDKNSGDPFSFADISQDYKYNDEGKVIQQPSEFNIRRRNCIINLIQEVLVQEFNEHNSFMSLMGMTYNFAIPDVGRDQWNNTIDDVSVLSFIQGIPVGYDEYFNNYSLGGTRIVKSSYIYAETMAEGNDNSLFPGTIHRVYHKEYCPLIPRDENGTIIPAVKNPSYQWTPYNTEDAEISGLYIERDYTGEKDNRLNRSHYNVESTADSYFKDSEKDFNNKSFIYRYGGSVGGENGDFKKVRNWEREEQLKIERPDLEIEKQYFTVPSWGRSDGTPAPYRYSVGIEQTFLNADDAKNFVLPNGHPYPYYACSECM